MTWEIVNNDTFLCESSWPKSCVPEVLWLLNLLVCKLYLLETSYQINPLSCVLLILQHSEFLQHVSLNREAGNCCSNRSDPSDRFAKALKPQDCRNPFEQTVLLHSLKPWLDIMLFSKVQKWCVIPIQMLNSIFSYNWCQGKSSFYVSGEDNFSMSYRSLIEKESNFLDILILKSWCAITKAQRHSLDVQTVHLLK